MWMARVFLEPFLFNPDQAKDTGLAPRDALYKSLDTLRMDREMSKADREMVLSTGCLAYLRLSWI